MTLLDRLEVAEDERDDLQKENEHLKKTVAALFEESQKLGRIIATSTTDGICPWCSRMNDCRGRIEHRRSCAAFTPDGMVKR